MAKPLTTIETVTDEQIEALRDEAEAVGDLRMARRSVFARLGYRWAIKACVEAINAAEAADEMKLDAKAKAIANEAKDLVCEDAYGWHIVYPGNRQRVAELLHQLAWYVAPEKADKEKGE